MVEKRAIRIGVDMGGIHTEAIAIDNSTNRIVGKGSVMTARFAREGVARGVMDSFQKCLGENNIRPDEVTFIVHGTTQVTNALLEDDTAKVGVISIGKDGLESFLTKRRTKIPDIDLGAGKFIHIDSYLIETEGMNENSTRALIQDIYNQGNRIIVASKAFNVDNMSEEKLASEAADRIGLPSSMASDIAELYGLTTRTRAAALNASVPPRTMETANGTESSVRSTGVNVPLMIMHGDDGIVEVSKMKKRPVLAVFSSPAASVIGTLIYLRASNDIYFEVGSTSTNISMIENGRSAVDYAVIGGHRTYVNSLNVRVLGVAGGSMVRTGKNDITNVRPRSAHITNMGHACFTGPPLLEGAALYHIQLRKNGPNDYVAIHSNSGESVTITNTCAANVLGILAEGDYACGNEDSVRMAIKLLADEVGVPVEDIARAILQKSTDKVKPVTEDLIAKYKIERDQIVLVGAGGGAGTLLTFTANDMGSKYQIPKNAEVISSIGVALATVREMVERILPNPPAQDIAQLKKKAKEVAVNSGAVEDSIEVHVEIDEQAQKVTAIVMGSIEVKTTDLMRNCDEKEAVSIAAASMGVAEDKVCSLCTSPSPRDS